MGLSEWLVIGGTAWFLGKSIADSREECEQRERENLRIKKENREAQGKLSRKDAVNSKRKRTPCAFNDGITRDEFCDLANRIGRKLKRIKKVSVYDAIVFCTVESQSGCSEWEFNVDFNDWGHITGSRWTWTENTDSNIPEHYGNLMTSVIHQLLSDRDIHMRVYSDVVDQNKDLETKEGLEFHKNIGFLKRVFSKERSVIIKYDSVSLKGEHLYPVISFLKSNGFNNVKSIPMKDVGRDSEKYLFEVEQIVINGNAFFKEGDIFKENSEVVIAYHEKKEICIPFTERYFRKRNYLEVGDELEEFGFTEVYECAIKDLTTGWLKKDGSVERVKISGSELKKNQKYKFDDRIVIEYHTYKTQK